MIGSRQPSHHRILVVDDYPDAAEVTCTLLEILGHECRTANSGRAALAEALVFEPDIVICDLGLPDLSGYEVARELRRSGRPIHLAALTGWHDPSAIDRSLEAGFDQHVIKPTDRDKLVAILEVADREEPATEHPIPS